MHLTRFMATTALLVAVSCVSAAPASLEDLLEQTKTVRQREAQANQERESRFVAERNERAAMLNDARAKLTEQRTHSTALAAQYDANEKRLTQMQGELDARAGNLGEMFGVVRQVANDFSSVMRNSIITAQYKDREAFVNSLAQAKSMPSMEDLGRFWFELQREMTESGRIVRFDATVVTPQGTPEKTRVTRVGAFTATTEGRYLAYLPSQQELAIMARQPGSEFTRPAHALERNGNGYVSGVIDPTRGVLLSIYAQRPTFSERIERGEAVGYVIILVGVVGAAMLLYQLFYLAKVRGRVLNQLKFPDAPVADNPLGRVLVTFKGEAERLEEDTQVVELRISEAVLKEGPKLERFQSFLRLAVAAGPLLGLIGTVIGMIITFQSITESGSSDPKLMANGISQAMIATLLGLGIAVPLLFGNAWLSSISKSIMQVLEEQSAGLLAARLERQAARSANA